MNSSFNDSPSQQVDFYTQGLEVMKPLKGFISILGIAMNIGLLFVYRDNRFSHVFYKWVRIRMLILVAIFLLGLFNWTFGDYSKESLFYYKLFASFYLVAIPLRILFFVIILHDIFIALVRYLSMSDPKHPLKDLPRTFYLMVISLPAFLLFAPIYYLLEIQTINSVEGTYYKIGYKNTALIYYLKVLLFPEIIIPVSVYGILGAMILVKYRNIMSRKDASIRQFNGSDKFRKMNIRYTKMILIVMVLFLVFRTTDLIIQIVYRRMRINSTGEELLEREPKLAFIFHLSSLIMLSYFLLSPILMSCIDTNFKRFICSKGKKVRDFYFHSAYNNSVSERAGFKTL